MLINSTLKRAVLTATLVVATLMAFSTSSADEGQWPLSQVHKLDLKKAGIEIPASEIFNAEKPSLVDAICRVGGATGSFVSKNGLILTNHHVAFDGISKASTPQNDYLKNGFVAADLKDEIPAQGYTARITVGYKDVSKDVLAAVKAGMTPVERSAAVQARRQSLAEEAKKNAPELDAEVAEMFQGKNYVLFQYQLIKDVRMVVVPPQSVGEYGGETDNWIWPRHTGDFAFLRAYVGPDGKPADFSAENVPFKPRRHLKINAKGTSEGDAVFLLGYPGRTYRHQSAAFVAFDEEVKMPFVADLFEERIRIMEEISKDDRAMRLRLASQIKGLANTKKNYRGKLLGLSRLKLVEKKRREEAELAAWIEATPERRQNYGHVLNRVNEIFAQMRPDRRLVYAQIRLNSTPFWQVSAFAHQAAAHAAKPDEERPASFRQSAIERVLKAAARRQQTTPSASVDAEVTGGLKMILDQAASLNIDALTAWRKKAIETHGTDNHAELAQKIGATTQLRDEAFRRSLFTPDAVNEDALYELVGILAGPVAEARSREKSFNGELDELMALYVDAKRLWKAAEFCPDANFTLRLTFGRIRAYEPRDGVTYRPFTTLSGMVAKNTGEEPFNAPEKLVDLWKKKDFGGYKDENLGDVPVGILYDCDTTGGNSGSPVMNGRGELVGLNFDRAYEATINDYQWSQDYSRSIGVDIRYVLWVTEKLMGSKRVIREVGAE